MAGTRHFLAIDLGASSGRLVLTAWDGRRFTPHELHRFPNGPVRVGEALFSDVLSLWREIGEGLARVGPTCGGRLDAIGLDTWGVDFALLDRDGALVANPRHYRDRRTDGLLDYAFGIVPREELFEATGVGLMQINTLFQLLSMVRAGSVDLQTAATLLPLPNLFYYWLGAPLCAEYTAATTTQCLDVRRRAWATGLIERLGIRTDLFPPLVEPATQIGELRGDLAAEAGLSGTTRVVAVGSHDTASAAAAVPALDETSAFISSGTWGLLGLETPRPVVDRRTLEAGFTNEGGLAGKTLLLRNLTGLWLVQECRRQWQRAGRDYGWDEMLALAAAAEPFRSLVDPEAPAFMSPPDMPSAIRAFCLETGQPAPEDVGSFVRCCLESIAVRYRGTVDELADVGGARIGTLRIVGGGSRNPLLCQLAADACGVPVVAGPAEATALGNVMAQAIAVGEVAGVAEGRAAIALSTDLETYEPCQTDGWAEAAERARSWSRAAG